MLKKVSSEFQESFKGVSSFVLQVFCSMNLIAATRAEGGLVSLWSEVKKRIKNIEKNDVLKFLSFLSFMNSAPPISLNFSGCKHARWLGHILFQKWDP